MRATAPGVCRPAGALLREDDRGEEQMSLI